MKRPPPATVKKDKTPAPRQRIAGLWWKLPLAMVPVAMLLAVFAHAVWSRVERGRVEQRLVPLRAAGVPTVPKDFDRAPLADAQNLIVPIRAAMAALEKDADRKRRRDDMENDDPNAFALPLTPAEVALLREQVAADAAALAAFADADGRDVADWGADPTNPSFIHRPLTALNDLRQLAIRLVDVAKLAATDGRAVECFAALRRLEPVGEAAVATDSLVGTLVRIGIGALGADAVIDVAPDLALPDDAARAAARSMVAALLDDAPRLERDLRHGLLCERVFGREMLAEMRAGTYLLANGASPGVRTLVGALVAPTLYRSEWKLLDYVGAQIELADAPDLAAYTARSAEATRIYNEARASTVTAIGGSMMPALDRYQFTRYRLLADQRLAATVLAIRLYQLEHGARPPTLEALVPAYLPTLPIDALDGRPLRYDPKRAIVWSVGADAVDDGGDATVPAKFGLARSRWNSKDAVVFLDRQPRPATQPSGDTR